MEGARRVHALGADAGMLGRGRRTAAAGAGREFWRRRARGGAGRREAAEGSGRAAAGSHVGAREVRDGMRE